MLDDQPFLIDSTTFLSQCNRMTGSLSLRAIGLILERNGLVTMVMVELSAVFQKGIILRVHDYYNVAV